MMSQYGDATLDMIAEILGEGVDHLVLLMRHSAREYDPDRHDQENPLTDEGRELARGWGAALPKALTVRGYTSPVERCVETTELILDGHRAEGGRGTRTRTIEALGNFYILDMIKLGKAIEVLGGLSAVYDLWFAGRVEPDILIPSPLTARFVAHVAADKLNRPVAKPQLDLLVSHDMTLYAVRDHLLGESIAEFGTMEYLDALAFYRVDGDLMMRSLHSSGRPISLEGTEEATGALVKTTTPLA
jgi:broad specificity phosphatase PhoE